MIRQLKLRLIEIHTQRPPDPSVAVQLMRSCLVSCGVATRWGEPSAAAKSTEADPMLFCIKRCKVARGCSLSDLAAQRGRRLPLAVSPGRRPSEKAQGRGETHASQKGTAGLSEQPRRGLREILAQRSLQLKIESPQRRRRRRKAQMKTKA